MTDDNEPMHAPSYLAGWNDAKAGRQYGEGRSGGVPLEAVDRLIDAVADLTWKAAPYGETETGDTAAYIVPKGALHRLVGVGQQVSGKIALRATAQPTPAAD